MRLFAGLLVAALLLSLATPAQAAPSSGPILMSVQNPEPPPVSKEVVTLWTIAIGAVGSLIMGIVKFFTSNLAKLPDWLKGLVALALPSLVALIAHFFGYASLPPDLLHAVPLLAAGAIGMGLRALLKAFAPKLAALTAEKLATA